MAFSQKAIPYTVIYLDLGTARSSAAQNELNLEGVMVPDWIANTFTIITLDGGTLDFALSSASPDIVGADSMKIEGIRFSNIYWTNVMQVGKTAEIFVAWVD